MVYYPELRLGSATRWRTQRGGRTITAMATWWLFPAETKASSPWSSTVQFRRSVMAISTFPPPLVLFCFSVPLSVIHFFSWYEHITKVIPHWSSYQKLVLYSYDKKKKKNLKMHRHLSLYLNKYLKRLLFYSLTYLRYSFMIFFSTPDFPDRHAGRYVPRRRVMSRSHGERRRVGTYLHH